MYKSLTAQQRDIMFICLLLANHSEEEWMWEGTIYKCQSGQFITSLNSLQKYTAKNTTYQNIRTALNILEKWQFLTNKSTNKGRLITICNWSTYQSKDLDINKATNRQLTGNQQATNRQLTTNKNDKNEKNEKNNNKENIYSEKFNIFWKLYPKRNGKKIGKKECLDWWQRKVDVEETYKQIIRGVENFAESKKVIDGFAEDPIRFLKHQRYLDYQEIEKESYPYKYV